jgi:hypothetical protein
MKNNIINISKDNNFYYNFISLMSLLFILSLSNYISSVFGTYAVPALTIIVFIIDIRSLGENSSSRVILYIFIAMIILLRVLNTYIDPFTLVFMHNLLFLLFFTYSFKGIIKRILDIKKGVNANLIIGSVTGYIHLGLIWSFFYLMLLLFDPQAFNGINYQLESKFFSEMSYFSFVTLTTLGFGDISPETNIAKVFTYFEAIAGVFYMAVIVSTLVSSQINNTEDN